MSNNFSWTAEHIATLTKLWRTMSTAEIGRQMGRSKNAVLGKAHRLLLPDLGSPIKPNPNSKGHKTRAITAARALARAGASTLPPLPSLTMELPACVTQTGPDARPLAAAAGRVTADLDVSSHNSGGRAKSRPPAFSGKSGQ